MVDERTKIVSYIKSYVDNPTNESELLKDNNIKNEIKTLKFQTALVQLFVMTYLREDFVEPEEVKMCKKDWIGENEGDFVKTFCEIYDITNKEAGFVRSAEMEQ